MIDKDLTKTSYDNIAEEYSKLHHGPSYMLLHFKKELDTIKEKKVMLDIGAGNGRDSVELLKIFDEVICMDYSLPMLSQIQANGRLKIINADITDESLKFSNLSAIWMNGVVHHINPNLLVEIFSKLFQWLKRQSPIFISYRCDICNSFDKEYTDNPRYYYCMNSIDVVKILEIVGFSDIKTYDIKKKPTDNKKWTYIYAVKK